MLLGLAVAVALAGAVAVAVAIGWGIADRKATPAAAASPSQACVAAAEAYEAWHSSKPHLDNLAVLSAASSAYRAGALVDEGKALYSEVSRFDDKAATTAAVAVADYNVQLGMVRLGLDAGVKPDAAEFAKLTEAWAGVETSWTAFATTCS